MMIGIVCGLLFLMLLLGKKIGLRLVFEKVAILLFRFACSFAFLYIVHIIVDGYNLVVPINLFSAMTIAILGIPGVLCIGVLTVFQ